MEDNSQDSGLLDNINVKVIIDRLVKNIIHGFWLLLLLMAIGASLMWYRAKKSYIPVYQSYATCTISNNYDSYNDSNKLLTAKNLTNMFQYLADTSTFKQMLMNELGTERVNGRIGAYVSETSNLLTITVTSVNPQDAYDILIATINCYPDIADYVVGTVYFHVITPASVPTQPSNPPDYKTPAKKGMLMGAGAAMLIFLVMALFDSRVNDADDIEKRINAKCLAVIPEIKFKKRKKTVDIPITILNDKVGYAFKESYRTIATKLRKYKNRNDCKVILVSSAMPGEGKTTTSVNIALSLAETENKVVLVDADLRKPSVAGRLKITGNENGINTVLKGLSTVEESVCSVEGSTLKVLPGNNAVKNALECMGSAEMKKIIETLREEFDYVIIDTPPCGIMSDAAMISPYADAVVMVVRCNKSKASYVSNSLSSLTVNGIPVIGCILNCKQSDVSQIASGYRYGSYKYGYSRYGRYSKYGRYGYYGQHNKESEKDD